MKRFYTIILLSGSLFLSSCSGWLDITPEGQTTADKLFETEEGFLHALTGSYLLCTEPLLYGRELLVGVPEEIAQNWSNETAFKEFNYKDGLAESRLNGIWQAAYKAIANTNLIIDNLEKKDRSEFENYDLIKGEAYGLRAYIHLDLLRLFGPTPRFGFEQKAIPYHEHFSNKMVEIMTAKEVLDRIKRDLDVAYGCLKEDPINVYGRKSGTMPTGYNKDLAFNYRAIRMNYYAVTAALARYHLLIGEKAEAARYAREVIDSGLFTLTTHSQAVTGEDYLFQSELIWCPFDQEMETHLSTYFTPSSSATLTTADETYVAWVYSGAHALGNSTDYRNSLYWSKLQSSYYMNRYVRRYDVTNTDITKWDQVLPLIRVTEMYYILAETLIGVDNDEALGLLNEVRKSREVQILPDTYAASDDALLDQIVYEYQKDTFGEGKMFYVYKRLYRDIEVGINQKFTASQQRFDLPLPTAELEFGGY